MIIGESHYLEKSLYRKIGFDEWFDPSKALTKDEEVSHHTNTRQEVCKVFDDSSHSIHKRLISSLVSVYPNENKRDIYTKISYYNYFQRPAEVNGNSINAEKRDNDLAFEFYTVLSQLIKPKLSIFVSKKAFNSYLTYQSSGEGVNCVPHPTCSWWNRKSKAHGDVTGRVKFETLLRQS